MNQLETVGRNQELQDCLLKIEKKLGWGKSTGWSSYDFGKLSDSIYQGTGMKLSANTLKRVWGRLNYESDPSTTTLNILAQYLGFDDWRNFITRTENKEKPSNALRINNRYWVAIPILIFLPLTYILLSGNSFWDKRPDPADFSFSSKKISEGIPNSVIFEYSTPPYLKDGDKLEIQQSWDDSKRHTISKTDSVATSIYYKPGFFNAKLVVNGTIAKEHGLLIPSGGWLGLLETKGLPLYIDRNDIVKNDKISISEEMIAKRLKDEDTRYERASLYYIEDFDGLYLNNFTIEMVVGTDRKNSENICQPSSITVYCEGEVLIVPLISLGCISEINLRILDRSLSGKTNDLSRFGVDRTDEISVKLTSSDGFLSIFVNGLMAYSTKLDPKKQQKSISGIRYSFQGPGEVNELAISNNEQVFYTKSVALKGQSD